MKLVVGMEAIGRVLKSLGYIIDPGGSMDYRPLRVRYARLKMGYKLICSWVKPVVDQDEQAYPRYHLHLRCLEVDIDNACYEIEFSLHVDTSRHRTAMVWPELNSELKRIKRQFELYNREHAVE